MKVMFKHSQNLRNLNPVYKKNHPTDAIIGDLQKEEKQGEDECWLSRDGWNDQHDMLHFDNWAKEY